MLLAKIGRAVELWTRNDDVSALWRWPITLGDDLVVLASLGLLALAARRLALPWIRFCVYACLVLPLTWLLPADVLSHRLTGTPITWHRLSGGEGATLLDLNLLDPVDLWGGLAAMALLLLVLWAALRWARRVPALGAWTRPRALLVTLLLGVGLELLRQALLPNDQGLAEQPVLVLVDSLFARAQLTARALDDPEWRALHRARNPSVKRDGARGKATPEPTLGPRRASNVVIFLAEGIAYEHTGFAPEFRPVPSGPHGKAPPKPDPTPNLVRRAERDGILFERYHANWHASIQAIFSIVCSAFPPLNGDIVRIKPRIDCGELSEVMRRHDVVSGLFHGGRFNFYNKLALLGNRGYAVELDAEELAKTSKRKRHQWGIDDRAMVDATLDWVDSLDKGQRFAALLIPITAHYPYWLPRDFKPPYPGRNRRERFLNAVAFQDQVFEELLRGFEKRGLYDNTLFVWLGDHGHYVGEPPRQTPGLRMFYEPNLHTALVMISRKLFGPGTPPASRRSQRLGGHPDLLPSILDALGLPPDPRHQGQSLLSRHFEPRRVFFGAADGQFLGFIDGNFKFAMHVPDRRAEYYDLERDPEELHNLADELPKLMEADRRDVLRFAGAVQAHIADAPILPEKISVDQLPEIFVAHADVRLRTAGKEQACERTNGETRCPGLGPALRIHQGKVHGENRRCVMVRVPKEGSIEVAIEYAPALSLLTGTIVALGGKPSDHTAFLVHARADGKSSRRELLTRRGIVRPNHPRARSRLVYTLARAPSDRRDVEEVCLQLSAVVH